MLREPCQGGCIMSAPGNVLVFVLFMLDLKRLGVSMSLI